MRFCPLLFLGLMSSSVWAHEILLDESRETATVLQLTYADGHPFAFEAYELYLPEKEVPEQVGRTNARGQAIFLPGAQIQWRLKAYSADGHGMDQIIEVAPGSITGAEEKPNGETPRWLLLLAGLGIIFGLFGIVQLFQRKKPS